MSIYLARFEKFSAITSLSKHFGPFSLSLSPLSGTPYIYMESALLDLVSPLSVPHCFNLFCFCFSELFPRICLCFD